MANEKRRWLQFSLRGMLVFVLAICVCLRLVIHPYQKHEDAISFIKSTGATITFDYQWNIRGGYIPDAVAPGSDRLKRLLGEYYSSNVERVELHTVKGMAPEKLTDHETKHLATFTEATWLILNDTSMTDAGLVHLTKLTKLGRLDLGSTKVTREGVASLQRKLPNLRIYYDGMDE